jgi:GT2 family glycosyltransferase
MEISGINTIKNNMITVNACVPTYRESAKVVKYLRSCRQVKYRPFRVIIVNANPGDHTSKVIEQEKQCVDYELIEVSGQSNEFWSATVNRGLTEILKVSDLEDWILIANIDIEFEQDIVSLLIEKALEYKKCQIGALSLFNGITLSSGTQVKSWITTSNLHPFSGKPKADIPNDLCIQVDYLPTRCMLIPVEAVAKAGLIVDKVLPHYGADHEFSHRLNKAGYIPYIYTGAHIEVDRKNTGESVYSEKSSFSVRLLNLMSIRNPSNPWYRTLFVLLVYPWYAWPTAVLAYLCRTVIELFFSKRLIKRTFGSLERGYSD